MPKPDKNKKGKPPVKAPAPVVYSPEAQEFRTLLRRVPDGFQAALKALAAREEPVRDRVLTELVRGMGRDVLPILRGAALSPHEELAYSAVRALPLLGTRAAGDVLAEVYQAHPEAERGRRVQDAARSLQALGIRVAVPEPERAPLAPHYTLRSTHITTVDSVGSCSVVARLQDDYGVWHAIFVLCNDEQGIMDGFLRPFSNHEWTERLERGEDRRAAPVECPSDYARWMVARRRDRSAEVGTSLKEYLREWDTYVGPPPADYTPPDPVESFRALPDEERLNAANEAASLFGEREVETWFLDAAEPDPWLRRWQEAQLRLSGNEENEAHTTALYDVLQKAAEEWIPETDRARWNERLVHLSRYYTWRGERTHARRAASVAEALAIGKQYAEIPFFVELVQRTLYVADYRRRMPLPDSNRLVRRPRG
jgi:hypothetical protein